MIASLAPRYGGPSTAAPQMCAALAARGHDVELLTTDRDGRGRLRVSLCMPQLVDGVRTTYFPVRRPRSYATSPQLAAELFRRIGDFDVVHVHSLYLFHGLVAGVAARRHRVPYIVRPHGTLDPYHRSVRVGRKAVYTWLVERRNLERAAGVHCTSEEERQHVEAVFPRTRTFVVPLGVAAGSPPAGDVSFATIEGRRLVTFLGRLTEKKRPVMLVEAFARIADRVPGAHLVLAGPDDERLGARLAARAGELGVGSRLSLLGPLSRADARHLLQRSSVFVLPSVDENFGVAVAEAMASGVPVVVTPGVALHREISERDAGLVSEPSPEALGRSIESILSDHEGALRMGANGRALARDLFDWATIAARLEAIYEAAV